MLINICSRKRMSEYLLSLTARRLWVQYPAVTDGPVGAGGGFLWVVQLSSHGPWFNPPPVPALAEAKHERDSIISVEKHYFVFFLQILMLQFCPSVKNQVNHQTVTVRHSSLSSVCLKVSSQRHRDSYSSGSPIKRCSFQAPPQRPHHFHLKSSSP